METLGQSLQVEFGVGIMGLPGEALKALSKTQKWLPTKSFCWLNPLPDSSGILWGLPQSHDGARLPPPTGPKISEREMPCKAHLGRDVAH